MSYHPTLRWVTQHCVDSIILHREGCVNSEGFGSSAAIGDMGAYKSGCVGVVPPSWRCYASPCFVAPVGDGFIDFTSTPLLQLWRTLFIPPHLLWRIPFS